MVPLLPLFLFLVNFKDLFFLSKKMCEIFFHILVMEHEERGKRSKPFCYFFFFQESVGFPVEVGN